MKVVFCSIIFYPFDPFLVLLGVLFGSEVVLDFSLLFGHHS
jgi:hypothetical protein